MGAENITRTLYTPQPSEEIASGHYDAQRQLDFRIIGGEPLRVMPPASGEFRLSSDDEAKGS